MCILQNTVQALVFNDTFGDSVCATQERMQPVIAVEQLNLPQ